MKHLIIYAHPNPYSLNTILKESVINHLKNQGEEIVIRDLYQMGYNPILSLEDMQGQRKGQVSADVKVEQDYILWAEKIIFIHPIWWTGLPAIFKGYIDRVFSYGFAYSYSKGYQEGLLQGKKAIIINTHGKTKEEYTAINMDKALSLTSDTGIYNYCGFEIEKHFFLSGADRVSEETIEKWLREIKANL